MSNIHLEGPIAYLEQSGSAVYFSTASPAAGTFPAKNAEATPLPIRKLLNAIDVAFWGEDNRFPQNIVNQMAYCSIGPKTLDLKARKLWGNGILPGKIIDYKDDGTEVFQPLKPAENKVIYKFLKNRRIFKFFLEYLQDWVWFGNVFPEIVLSKDGKTITDLLHQESCDARFKQMDDAGNITHIFLSKIFGASRDQFATFDPEKTLVGLIPNLVWPTFVDNKFIKILDCIDMYNPVNSLATIAKNKTGKGLKSAILPVNYPSPNKTYYQVPAWDGARLGGWVEIASKIPSIIKTIYNKAFKLRYHIEIPETYFQKIYPETWEGMTEVKQAEARKKLLKEIDDFLSGDKNAYKTFISFFEVDKINKAEYGRIKITPIENLANIDSDLITSPAADMQIQIAMGVNPAETGS